jgi:ADP-ribose pyrophosphatase YjhB (NUDIX family)
VKLRRAGRVIVLDPDDRVLLLRYDNGAPAGRHWCTPGGGLNEGESYAAGAARELTEETGWTDVPIGNEVLEHDRVLEFEDKVVHQHERLFLARVGTPRREVADVAGMHASDGIAAWRWWTADEIDASDEVILPAGLSALIRSATCR